MATLQVFEHQRLRIGAAIAGSTEPHLRDDDAALLEVISARLPPGTCRWERNAVRFAQHCGVICLGSTTIEILPKVTGAEQKPGTSRNVLVQMLAEAKELVPDSVRSAPMQLQTSTLLDVIVLAFCRELEVQLVQGLIRRYITEVENTVFLRGKFRIDLQLRHNLAHAERLYCEYDELSPDIVLNRVIKGVLHKLVRLPLGFLATKQIRELLLRFAAVTSSTPNIEMLDGIVIDRTNNRFSSILRQCRRFLEGIYPDVVAGVEHAAAFLFDMNKLFEACVTRAARREAWRRESRLQSQGPRKWFAHDTAAARDIVLMKPDMTVSNRRGEMVLVADAKWKLLDEDEAKLGVAEPDIYQIAAYASRYGVEKAALIYPKQSRFSEVRELILFSPKVTIQLVPFDLTQRSLALLSF